MTYATQDGFVYIPKNYTDNYQYKVTLNDTDITDKVILCKYTKAATISTGEFDVSVIYEKDIDYNIGDIIKIYHGFGSYELKFVGKVEKIERVFKTDDFILRLSGRHISKELLEITISKEYSGEEASNILKDIVDTFLSDLGYTYTDVENSGVNVSIVWSNASAWEAFKDLCVLANMDIYVDENRNIHFFKQGSRLCQTEAVVEHDNLINVPRLTNDGADTRNRIIVYGEDDEGLPIIYTAESDSNDIREDVFINRNINNFAIAQDVASGVYEQNSTYKDRGNLKCFLLHDLNPGDMLWVSIPSQEIHRKYIVRKFTHDVIELTTTFELKDSIGLPDELKKIKEIEFSSGKLLNPYKFKYTLNLTFDDESELSSKDNIVLANGAAKLSDPSRTGSFTSTVRNTNENVTEVYLMLKGKDLENSQFYVSATGGTAKERINPNEKYTLEHSGSNLVIEVRLVPTDSSPNPQIDSLALLYK